MYGHLKLEFCWLIHIVYIYGMFNVHVGTQYLIMNYKFVTGMGKLLFYHSYVWVLNFNRKLNLLFTVF